MPLRNPPMEDPNPGNPWPPEHKPDLGSINLNASRVMTEQKPTTPEDSAAPHPHDFDVQKALHQQIRNDPDYDDWEYGTEPLPHEAWVQGKGQPSSPSEGPNR